MSVGFGYCIMYCYTGISGYISAGYLLAKPVIIYTGMRITWLAGISVVEWWSARLYSINCIGEGFEGFYNHIWNLASPVCTGLLTTHIGLMGVLVASFIITVLWSMYSIINKLKNNIVSDDIMNEYNSMKKLLKSKNIRPDTYDSYDKYD
jgi:hypothetical protein